MNIIDYIPRGRENAITRAALCEKTGLCDRDMRILIENARREGNIIINLQDGRGYYLPDGIDEIEQQYRQNHNRAMSILMQQKFLRHELKKAGRM